MIVTLSAVLFLLFFVLPASSLAKKSDGPPAPLPSPRMRPRRAHALQIPSINNEGSPFGELSLVGNTKDPKGLVIFAHRVNSDSRHYKEFAQEMERKFPNLLWALPSAGDRDHAPAGDSYPGWMKHPFLDLEREDDRDDVTNSVQYLHLLSKSLCNTYKISESDVIYGGHMDGGLVAVVAGMTAPTRPKGIFGVSPAFKPSKLLRYNANHRDVPMFCATTANSKESYHKWLKGIGYAGAQDLEVLTDYVFFPHDDHRFNNPMMLSRLKCWLDQFTFRW